MSLELSENSDHINKLEKKYDLSLERSLQRLVGRDFADYPPFISSRRRIFTRPRSNWEVYLNKWYGHLQGWLNSILNEDPNDPTFHLVSKMDPYDLALRLTGNENIPSFVNGDIADGKFISLPGLDQLALSNIDDEKIIYGLDKDGYGFWPVKESVNFMDLGLNKLGINLTLEQKKFLNEMQNVDTRNINGLWFNGKHLDRQKSTNNVNGLPTITEALSAFESYFDQEGSFPNTKDRWLLTASARQKYFDLEQAFRELFSVSDLRRLFEYICVCQSADAHEIWQHINVSREGYESRRTQGGWVHKTNKGLKVTNSFGTVVFKRSERDGKYFLGVKTSDDSRITVEDNSVKIRNNLDSVLFSGTLNDVLQDVKSQFNRSLSIVSQPVDAYLVFRSHPKNGLAVGVYPVFREASVWFLAGDSIQFNYRPFLQREVGKRVFNLPIVTEGWSWPAIYPDQDAPSLYR